MIFVILVGRGVPLEKGVEERRRIFGVSRVVRRLDDIDPDLRRGVVIGVGGFENDAGDFACGERACERLVGFIRISAAGAGNVDIQDPDRQFRGRVGEDEGRKDRRIGLAHLVALRPRGMEISHR